jgi:hypothetical protein
MTAPIPMAPRDALMASFDEVPVVGLGEAHWVEQQHSLIIELLLDARFAQIVDDIVVEFGNALHQLIVDRFWAARMSRGLTCVPPGRRRSVAPAPACSTRRSTIGSSAAFGWRATRSGPGPTACSSAIRHSTRDLTARGCTGRWSPARCSLCDLGGTGGAQPRAPRPATGRGGHFSRVSDLHDDNVVQRLERSRPHSCAVMLPHYVFADVAERRGSELARPERRLADWPVPSIARIHRTWLADGDARLVLGETAMLIDSDGAEVNVPAPPLDAQGRLLSSVGLGDVTDAYLYLGPVHSLTLGAPRRRTTDQ